MYVHFYFLIVFIYIYMCEAPGSFPLLLVSPRHKVPSLRRSFGRRRKRPLLPLFWGLRWKPEPLQKEPYTYIHTYIHTHARARALALALAHAHHIHLHIHIHLDMYMFTYPYTSELCTARPIASIYVCHRVRPDSCRLESAASFCLKVSWMKRQD